MALKTEALRAKQRYLNQVKKARMELNELEVRKNTYQSIGESVHSRRFKEIEAKRKEVTTLMDEIQAEINTLEDELERAVLTLHYVDCKIMSEVAEKVYCAEITCWRKHKRALEKLTYKQK